VIYEEFRERIRANWDDRQTVQAWRRWHFTIAKQLARVNELLVEAAGIRPGMRVLDLASGSGEPALQIADSLGTSGNVVATDLSEGMLELASENAHAQGLSNISFVQCDAENIPFQDAAFDAVTSRMGVMFFVDIRRALAEIKRVLRPQGRAAFAAWGPMQDTTHFSIMLGPFFKRIDAPAPPADAPHPFRYARRGTLGADLQAADFNDVQEDSHIVSTPWPGTPEELWEMFYELAGPPFIDEMPAAVRGEAIAEAIQNARALFDGSTVRAQSAVVIASGAKAA
jgi:SAM-dependent methyltransferase